MIKEYRNRHAMSKEAQIIQALYAEGLAVPKIIAAGDGHLILEYLPGKNLLTWFEEQEKEAQQPAINEGITTVLEQLASWLADFYNIMHRKYGYSIVLNDVNLRNFIVIEEKIFGLDFEDCCAGTKEEDLGRLCAFILTYDPVFTFWKYQFVLAIKDIIVKKLNLSWDVVFEEIEKELQRMSQRRQRPDISIERINVIK
ncbi:MAG: hypothetical protein GX922_06275 [Firmicutes bacterium]|nr:hypothetical protein [Bacillota bacterium]